MKARPYADRALNSAGRNWSDRDEKPAAGDQPDDLPRRGRHPEPATPGGRRDPSAARASPIGEPVGPIAGSRGSSWCARTVARWRSHSARAVTRRSQDRTVPRARRGRPRSSGVRPGVLVASIAVTTTSTVSACLGETSVGSSTRVAAQSRHRARRGRHERLMSVAGVVRERDSRRGESVSAR